MTKKLFFSVVASLALLGNVACNKEQSPESMGAGVFTATIADNNAKTYFGERQGNTSDVLWSLGDKIKVNGRNYLLKSGEGTTSAVFSGEDPDENANHQFVGVYPSTIANFEGTEFVSVTLPVVQQYTESGCDKFPMYAVSDNHSLQFNNLCGAVQLKLQAAGQSVRSIKITTNRPVCGTYSVAMNGEGKPAITATGSDCGMSVTLNCGQGVDISEQTSFFITIPAGTYSQFDMQFNYTDGSSSLKRLGANNTLTIERAVITPITLALTPYVPAALTGYYTVNIDTKAQVRFSSGNLQYFGSATTPYWRFATHQWDVLGTAQNTTDYDVDNINRDLFGWGTSGWNNGNTYYQPYNTSRTNDRNGYYGGGYGPFGTPGGYQISLVGDFAHADWGIHNPIMFGSTVIPAGSWRTLTNSEWSVILGTNRPLSPVGNADKARYVKIKVNGVNGLLLFPDVFVWPEEAGAAPTNVNVESTPWTSVNSYDGAAFDALQAAGCAFLPAAGARGDQAIDNNTVAHVNEWGVYWLSTHSESSQAQALYMFSTSVGQGGRARCMGYSVRLVQDVVR